MAKTIPARVMRVMTSGYAEVQLPLEDTACTMRCHQCSHDDCPRFSSASQRAIAQCQGDVRRGDIIELEPAKLYETRGARLAYAVVPVMFLLGCGFGRMMEYDLANTLVMGGIMALLNFVLAWIMNRRARMRRIMAWSMTEMLRQTERLMSGKKGR